MYYQIDNESFIPNYNRQQFKKFTAIEKLTVFHDSNPSQRHVLIIRLLVTISSGYDTFTMFYFIQDVVANFIVLLLFSEQ